MCAFTDTFQSPVRRQDPSCSIPSHLQKLSATVWLHTANRRKIMRPVGAKTGGSMATDDARQRAHEARLRDLRAVDAEARTLGQYPLDDGLRAFRADLRAAVRERHARNEMLRQLRQRQTERRRAGEAQAPADHSGGKS